MIYTKDNDGKLRAFTFGNDEHDLEQISTEESILSCRFLLLEEGIDVNPDTPLLELLQGGKAL